MAWKSYLVMYFGTNGIRIADIVKKVESLGFKAALGPVDFLYEWPKKPSKEEVFSLLDKLKDSLKGSEVIFNIDTHD